MAEHPSGTEAEWEAKGSKLPEDEKKVSKLGVCYRQCWNKLFYLRNLTVKAGDW